MLDHIYIYMEANMLTEVVFLDLKNVRIRHTRTYSIIKKLTKFNVHDESIGWFENYLSVKVPCVKAVGVKSEKRIIMLGPCFLLFTSIIYVNI